MLRSLARSGWLKVALGALAGGVVSATVVSAQSGGPGTIRGCVTDSSGALAVMSDPSGYNRTSTCSGPNAVHLLDWNQQGPAGPAGALGPAGPAGPPGPGSGLTLWARVDRTGKLVASSPSGVHSESTGFPASGPTHVRYNGVTCKRLLGCDLPGHAAINLGSYDVNFGFDVSNCAFTVTPTGGADPAVSATAESSPRLPGGSVDNRRVEVSIHRPATTHFVLPKGHRKVALNEEEGVPSDFVLIGICTGSR